MWVTVSNSAVSRKYFFQPNLRTNTNTIKVVAIVNQGWNQDIRDPLKGTLQCCILSISYIYKTEEKAMRSYIDVKDCIKLGARSMPAAIAKINGK
ncbi:hypothetical protein, partial [Faecalicatena contorta]|uniref:hypothetical protein n=1 Tax=Faecalicatena contorta TaxID=39482 RepID=UPI003216747E